MVDPGPLSLLIVRRFLPVLPLNSSLVLFLLFLLGFGAFAGEPVTVVTRYDEFAAHGLEADVMYHEGKVMALTVKSVDRAKKPPAWMQAFYVSKGDAETAMLYYDFAGGSVGAFIGWSENQPDSVLIIGPKLRDRETFKGKQYVAIKVNDLIAWRGRNKKEVKATDK